MADNVNIIVQDTINDIVVNAAVVVETIDINVQAAVDTVDIVANPNNYVVNINRIIGEQVQSDWDQADNQAPDYIKNKPTIPTATSDLTNDGEDGINPFITAADVTPQVNSDWDATSGVAEILNKPTIPAAVTKTSDLINDGEDGVDPFITAADIPPVTGFVPYTGATDDVNLGTHDLTATQGTFATSGNPDTLTVNHSSGSGKALTITKGGAGEGIYVNKTSGSGNAVTIVGDLEATNLKRTGGTSSQFLKADGSVDSNTYFELPALTSGSVLFSNGTTIAQDNAQLFWNDTNNRLGIGTASPSYIIHAKKDQNTSTELAIENVTAGGLAASIFRFITSAGFGSIGMNSATDTGLGSNRIYLYSGAGASGIALRASQAAQNIRLYTGGDSVGNMRLSVESNGNVLINTTTDAGYKLDVNGTARVQGALTITTGGASIAGNVNIASSNFISASRYQCSTGLFAFGNTFLYSSGGNTSPSVTSGLRSIFLSDANWVQSSGTADFASFRITGTINQTGTATGITRGLYVNPTLTAAADFRAIETTNGGAYINTTSVQASAILQADSTTKGFLPPRMTTTEKNAIATPAAGLVVYDTTLNQLCTYDGTWGDSPFYQQSLRGVRFFTDFDSSVNFYNLVSLTGGTAAATQRLTNFVPNQTANQIGIAHYQTGTLATGWAMHITEQSANGQQFQFGGGTWMYESYIEVDTLSDATNRFRFISGFGNVASSGTETNGAFFTYDEGGVSNGTIASPNWQCVTTVGAVRTLTTTSVAVTTTWTKLRIIINADATEVKFYIDGTLVATHTTNIPVLPNRLKVKQMIAKSLGTGNRFVYCDYIFYENNLTTLR
jgi:hypothetical protein